MYKISTVCVILLQATLCYGQYYGQHNQDKYINERFFKNQKNGVFIDIGAHDGVSISNSLFFEKELDWSGICVEPNPVVFEKLKKNRKCLCIEGEISPEEGELEFLKITGYSEMLSGLLDKYDPNHLKRIDRELLEKGGTREIVSVKCYTLNSILESNQILHVNFLSLDTEGGEFEILQSIDFSRFTIDVIAVENNYSDPRLIPFLLKKGFSLEKVLGCDLIFSNKKFKSVKH